MNASTRTHTLAAATLSDPRWAAVTARDASADGAFFYSVRTTGVYCRPSCGSRAAKPENVAFHSSAADAEHAGFRPCRRCRPHEAPRAARQAATFAEVCRFIEHAERAPTLAEMAQRACMSVHHFHRVFKAATGLTPKAYVDAHRARRMRDALRRGRAVTDAIYEAGYGSNGRFYEESGAVLGMKATQYRAGGADADIRYAIRKCSLGLVLVAQSGRGVCAIFIDDDRERVVRELRSRFPNARVIGRDVQFAKRVAQVVKLVETPRVSLDLPLDVRGTAFQQRVWQALREVPAGRTVSYTELARRIGAPRSVRAVAGACASNALAVAIPCHRVVASDGGLSGYRWGVERKRALLEREGAPLKRKRNRRQG